MKNVGTRCLPRRCGGSALPPLGDVHIYLTLQRLDKLIAVTARGLHIGTALLLKFGALCPVPCWLFATWTTIRSYCCQGGRSRSRAGLLHAAFFFRFCDQTSLCCSVRCQPAAAQRGVACGVLRQSVARGLLCVAGRAFSVCGANESHHAGHRPCEWQALRLRARGFRWRRWRQQCAPSTASLCSTSRSGWCTRRCGQCRGSTLRLQQCRRLRMEEAKREEG